ncbi:hypothetical protein HDU76_006930, partial [Blyttiomyces sp. JEL0837]
SEELSRRGHDNDLIKSFHQFLYGLTTSKRILSDIRQFCGFNFKNENEMKLKREKLAKWTLPNLKELSLVLQLSKDGPKDEVFERIWDFLSVPSKNDGKRKLLTRQDRRYSSRHESQEVTDDKTAATSISPSPPPYTARSDKLRTESSSSHSYNNNSVQSPSEYSASPPPSASQSQRFTPGTNSRRKRKAGRKPRPQSGFEVLIIQSRDIVAKQYPEGATDLEKFKTYQKLWTELSESEKQKLEDKVIPLKGPTKRVPLTGESGNENDLYWMDNLEANFDDVAEHDLKATTSDDRENAMDIDQEQTLKFERQKDTAQISDKELLTQLKKVLEDADMEDLTLDKVRLLLEKQLDTSLWERRRFINAATTDRTTTQKRGSAMSNPAAAVVGATPPPQGMPNLQDLQLFLRKKLMEFQQAQQAGDLVKAQQFYRQALAIKVLLERALVHAQSLAQEQQDQQQQQQPQQQQQQPQQQQHQQHQQQQDDQNQMNVGETGNQGDTLGSGNQIRQDTPQSCISNSNLGPRSEASYGDAIKKLEAYASYLSPPSDTPTTTKELCNPNATVGAAYTVIFYFGRDSRGIYERNQGKIRAAFTPELKFKSLQHTWDEVEEFVPRPVLDSIGFVRWFHDLHNKTHPAVPFSSNNVSTNLNLLNDEAANNKVRLQAVEKAAQFTTPMVNPFGLPPKTMRFFEISEVVMCMQDLIDNTLVTGSSPLELLRQYQINYEHFTKLNEANQNTETNSHGMAANQPLSDAYDHGNTMSFQDNNAGEQGPYQYHSGSISGQTELQPQQFFQQQEQPSQPQPQSQSQKQKNQNQFYPQQQQPQEIPYPYNPYERQQSTPGSTQSTQLEMNNYQSPMKLGTNAVFIPHSPLVDKKQPPQQPQPQPKVQQSQSRPHAKSKSLTKDSDSTNLRVNVDKLQANQGVEDTNSSTTSMEANPPTPMTATSTKRKKSISASKRGKGEPLPTPAKKARSRGRPRKSGTEDGEDDGVRRSSDVAETVVVLPPPVSTKETEKGTQDAITRRRPSLSRAAKRADIVYAAAEAAEEL